jgi:hypothetical protein
MLAWGYVSHTELDTGCRSPRCPLYPVVHRLRHPAVMGIGAWLAEDLLALEPTARLHLFQLRYWEG